LTGFPASASGIDLPSLPGGKLGNNVVDCVIDFARWDRILHVVR
jgi:hypothetical protein